MTLEPRTGGASARAATALSPTARRRIVLMVALALVAALLPLLSKAGAAHGAADTLRFAGTTRFDTARLVAADPAFADADTVVVARADDFADALAGALVAGDLGAPLLLTRTGDLPAPTVQAINRISPSTAVILGGSVAVSDAVQRRLEDFSSITRVERISGENRYDTARRIAERVAARQGGFGTAPAFEGGSGGRVTAVLATGENFPDALAAGPLSAGGLLPILLTERAALSPATLAALGNDALGIEQVLIVGGTAAVSAAVEAAVRDLEMPVRRIGGASRTHTAKGIAEFVRDVVFPPTFVADTVAVTNGRDFPDALALGPLAARRGGPLVITNTPNELSVPTEEFLVASCAGAGAREAPVLIGGGNAAVSSSVEAQIRQMVVCDDFIGAGDLTVEPANQTGTVGEEVSVTATGLNPKGLPAAGAEITFEVFRDVLALPGPIPEDTRIYRDGLSVFRKVGGSALTADSDGVATFSYASNSGGEDRIIVCTPPRELPNPGCTTQTGAVRTNVPWATVVVRNTWEGGSGLPALPPLPLP